MIGKGITWNDPDKFQPAKGEERWYGAWWGGNLRGVKDLPVLPDSGQIVYSPHDYGPSVYAQSWFDKNFDTNTLLDDYWRETWAYINEDDIAPLLIGEWGGHMDAGKNQKWMELLRDYMIAHHINHTFWCINPNSGDTGGLLDSTFMNWDADKYGLFEESLWQTSGGKYIGLDHQTALGQNGVSLNQFYSSGDKSNLDGGKAGNGTPIIADATKPATTAPVTTAAVNTTTKAVTTVPVTTAEKSVDPTNADVPNSAVVYGDATLDGNVNLSDALLILQNIANARKYPLNEAAAKNADCYNPGDGITGKDALAIQMLDAKQISSLPYKE